MFSFVLAAETTDICTETACKVSLKSLLLSNLYWGMFMVKRQSEPKYVTFVLKLGLVILEDLARAGYTLMNCNRYIIFF